MAEQDDVLHLIDDTGAASEDTETRKWKIAVIDDDPAVHDGTRFALSDYLVGLAGLKGEPPPGDPFITKVADIAGLSEDIVRRHRGRIPRLAIGGCRSEPLRS